jgi:septum site-determining protein MinC
VNALDDAGELFGTETFAELCARQGRLDDARAIYRKLCARRPDDERRTRWAERLCELEAEAGATSAPTTARVPKDASSPPAVTPGHALPLIVPEPVRSGQIVYAQANDLIVLAAVHSGAQIMADGNIHVYGALRGRAVAGVRGARDARIFCQRLHAELVGIDNAYLTAEDISPERVGQAAQIALNGFRCVVAPL